MSAPGARPVTDVPLVLSTQAGADHDPGVWEENRGHMAMLAHAADAVVGVDTHRDTHALLIAHPSGAPIAEQNT